MNENHRLAGFKALVESNQNSNSYFEEMDGNWRLWRDLSPQSKLQYIASDAVFCGVPFERFAEAVRDVFHDLPRDALEEAALQMVLHNELELRGLEELLPEWGRTESAPPRIERFQEVLNSQSEQLNALFDLKQRVDAELQILLERHNVPVATREAVRGYMRDVMKGVVSPEADSEEIMPVLDPREYGHQTWSKLWQEIRQDEAARKRAEASGKRHETSPGTKRDWGIER